MKHLKKYNEEINQDLKGKKCKSCNKGTYQETSLMDDLSGTLHCNKCGECVNRYVNDMLIRIKCKHNYFFSKVYMHIMQLK